MVPLVVHPGFSVMSRYSSPHQVVKAPKVFEEADLLAADRAKGQHMRTASLSPLWWAGGFTAVGRAMAYGGSRNSPHELARKVTPT